jgi:hypothetical protein
MRLACLFAQQLRCRLSARALLCAFGSALPLTKHPAPDVQLFLESALVLRFTINVRVSTPHKPYGRLQTHHNKTCLSTWIYICHPAEQAEGTAAAAILTNLNITLENAGIDPHIPWLGHRRLRFTFYGLSDQ